MESSESSSFFRRPAMRKSTVILSLTLVGVFSAALMLNMAPAKYGFYLDEFDPFYNYYAVRHIVQTVEVEGVSGLGEYFTWTDPQSWFPEGRNVAESAQVGLHLSAGILYLLSNRIFGSTISLYDFVVLFPAFVGALLVFPTFLLTRRIAGSSGAVLASLVMAFSPSIIQRGGLGWFKSEPFALLLGTAASYFFLYSLESNQDSRKQFFTALIAGLLFGYANTAWGGSLFFGLVVGGALILATFYRLNSKSILNVGLITISSTLLITAISPRPGISVISNPLGAFLLGTLIFVVIAHRLRASSQVDLPRQTLMKILLTIGLIVLALQSFDVLAGVAGRYLTVVYPVHKTDIPLVESVAEHFTPTGTDYFSSYFLILFLAGFGAILVLRRHSFGAVFTVTLGLLGVYLSASFSRLMVFSALSLALLAAIGFSELLSRFVKTEGTLASKRRIRLQGLRPEMKVGFSVVAVALLMIPIAIPSGANWIAAADIPNSITNGATSFKAKIDDWFDALDWIRNNTPGDAAIAAWWDYGYWITVMGNRTSLADNATINQTRIQRLATMYMSTESEAVKILRELKADYVLIYVVGTRIQDPQSGGLFYVLGGGGDESKKQWFVRIAGLDITQFMYEDEFTPRPNFWENTLMGKMLPFQLFRYVDPTQQGALVEDYAVGRTAIFTYIEKYSESSKPLKLVYTSPSLTRPMQSSRELFAGVLIYELSG